LIESYEKLSKAGQSVYNITQDLEEAFPALREKFEEMNAAFNGAIDLSALDLAFEQF
jgi:ABC-type Zn uptake system ZnuABC Zn-binding protein ZnuA